MDAIKIDGTTYEVGIDYGSLSRSFELIEGNNSGTSILGRSIRDILGTSYTYKMTVRPLPNKEAQYAAFYNVITAPTDYHTVEMPYTNFNGVTGTTLTFQAQIISGDDLYVGNWNGVDIWDGLTVEFKPIEPQRR